SSTRAAQGPQRERGRRRRQIRGGRRSPEVSSSSLASGGPAAAHVQSTIRAVAGRLRGPALVRRTITIGAANYESLHTVRKRHIVKYDSNIDNLHVVHQTRETQESTQQSAERRGRQEEGRGREVGCEIPRNFLYPREV